MSVYGLIWMLSCAGAYHLGAYNQRHPGKLARQAMALGWKWLRKCRRHREG